MSRPLTSQLLRRELTYYDRSSYVRSIYGHVKWAEDLDIVNELDGHTGCVNALSWSRSGSLLASGSDDQHVHIHSYLPQSSTSQFNLVASIATGHTENIFSVKFMPHSNDRTIISASGDSTVRVFDVEYSAASVAASHNLPSRPRGGGASIWDGTRHLSQADTNAKIFRSHNDRVKRIVTESSPFFFLTCSEDGDVRQWDLREPESTYPASTLNQYRISDVASTASDTPTPLISYRRHGIDLNTISCSPSRPHYIALGGNHLHCFLHDRRMLGRDVLKERGSPPVSSSSPSMSHHEDELMDQATQCVRRFAPNHQKKMGRRETGHITACKISDADPNELIASWSGDHIYSFDIVRSSKFPDASWGGTSPSADMSNTTRKATSSAKKRKRATAGLTVGPDADANEDPRHRANRRPPQSENDQFALRFDYGNGQREEIPIGSLQEQLPVSSDFKAQSVFIAARSLRLRVAIYGSASELPSSGASSVGSPRYYEALQIAEDLLPIIEGVMRDWGYPMSPTDDEVVFQKRLRSDRESTARFVQATGTLARVLGGTTSLLGDDSSNRPIRSRFLQIEPALNEQYPLQMKEHFCYDFLKAICLWLDSGPGGLVRGFSRRSRGPRSPILAGAEGGGPSIDTIDEDLIPYLLQLAGHRPILSLDSNRFEHDESRIIFRTEFAAVLAFGTAVKKPFRDLNSETNGSEPVHADGETETQDRSQALDFWARRVGRGLLVNASPKLNCSAIERAFGGSGRLAEGVRTEERKLSRALQLIDSTDGALDMEALATQRASAESNLPDDFTMTNDSAPPTSGSSTQEVRVPMDLLADLMTSEIGYEDIEEEIDPEEAEDEAGSMVDIEDEEERDSSLNGRDSEDSDDENDDEEEDDDELEFQTLYSSSRQFRRSKVNRHVPYSSHTRSYEGHLNIKTVKDVNFWGLQDEYVVSGSDSGHVFIWDRKTTKLINILEGDGEVVNVVQGHPYEPMLAVSGIDNTIKIFSPDARARRDARIGVGVKKADESEFSSIQGFGWRRRRRWPRANPRAEGILPTTAGEAEAQAAAERRQWAEDAHDSTDGEEDGQGGGPSVRHGGLPSRKRMWDEYRIRSANDAERPGDMRGESISRTMIQLFMGRLREQLNDGIATDDPRAMALNPERCATM